MKLTAGAALASLVLSACATAPAPAPGEIADPYEGFNRQMFAFNNGVDKYALSPAATVYKTVTPAFARESYYRPGPCLTIQGCLTGGCCLQRLVELSLSGVVGQIRISKPIPGPGTPGPDRIVNDVWAVGGDFQIALTDRFGIKGESFVGQSLAEYNAGALQNFNSDTFLPIQTIGGFGEIYYYVNPQFHLHGGYGIDDPINADLAAGQISSNETFFLTAFWDISKNVQFGMEVDCRKTKYISPLLDAEGLLVMNQFLWRF